MFCDDCGLDHDMYMVHDSVWAAAGMPVNTGTHHAAKGRYLCIPCLQARLGRELTAADFTGAPVNRGRSGAMGRDLS